MIGRIIALVVLGFLALTAFSASSSGFSGTRSGQTPEQVRRSYDLALATERQNAEAAERTWRYETGRMSVAERTQYEFEREQERQRQLAAAAAAREAARLRNLQRQNSGGGYSGGK